MTSISSYGQYQRMLAETQRLQQQQLTLQIQSSSGKKGTTIGDLGADAKHSVNMRAVTAQLQTYKGNISTVDLYASTMDTAMSRMSDIMNDLRNEYTKLQSTLSSDKTGTPDTTFLNELGKRGLEEMKDLLNTQVEGRYIFAANDIGNAPVGDVSKLLQAFQSEMTTNLPIATTAAQQQDIVTNLTAYVGASSTVLTTTNPPQAYGATTDLYATTLQHAGGPLVARIDVNQQVSYGLRADAPVFQDMIRALATAATVSYSASNPAGYDAILKNGFDTTVSSITNLSDEVGRLGITRKTIKAVSDKHDSVTASLKIAIGDVEDVDMAEVATKLQQSSTALEATYRIIASMKNLSLVDFLS